MVAAVGAAAAVGGAAMSANASSKASKAQQNSANAANAMSQEQFEQTRIDNQPFRRAGTGASNMLAQMLGLPGYEYGPPPDAASYIAGSAGAAYDGGYRLGNFTRDQIIKGAVDNFKNGQYGNDQEALKRFGYDPANEGGTRASNFGDLLRTFTAEDRDKDVVYQDGLQFGLDQGVNALNRQAAASGSLLSGAQAKALSRFGNDYASTKTGEARNRFVSDQDSKYNKLAGLSGAGQQATSQVASAGQANAQYQGNNLIGAGNARGASAIAGANSFNNALSQGVNAYQQQNLINSLGNRQNYSGWAGMNGFGDSYGSSYGE